MITFFVPGKPVAKARGRAAIGKKKGKPFIYSDATTSTYEACVGLICKQAMARAKVKQLTGPVSLEIIFRFAVPKSWTKKQKEMVPLAHTATPDLDNLVKAIKDGMNGVAWEDDSQVSIVYAKKLYSNNADGAYVTVSDLETDKKGDI